MPEPPPGPDQRYPHGPQGHPIEVLHDIHVRHGLSTPSPPAARPPRDLVAEAAAERAREARRVELGRRLAGVRDPQEAAATIAAEIGVVAPEDCRAAWTRLVRQTSASPPFEVAQVRGRHTVIAWIITRGMTSTPGSWKETDQPRFGVWRAEGLGRRYHPRVGEYGERWETGFDVWLDAEGSFYSGGPGEPSLSVHSTQKNATHLIALEPGAAFETVPDEGNAFRRPRRVPGGMLLAPHDARAGYPEAVAAVLRQL